jgi:flagellar biosynthesis protein FlhF
MSKTKLIIGSTWSKVMEEIEREFENHVIEKADTVRQMPYFWRKEYRVQVAGELKRPLRQTSDSADTQLLLDILEGKAQPPQEAKTRKKRDEELDVDLKEVERAIEHISQQLKVESAVLKEFYNRLVESEVDGEVAKSILADLERDLSPSDLNDRERVEEKLLEMMGSMMGVTGPFDLQNIKTIALIGPTGVGKTTTLAKISGILRSHNKRIGLITTDVYRIGATDQLQIYANILDSEMIAVTSPDELMAAIDYFRNVKRVDQILIDTVGRSPMKQELIDDMKTYIDIAEPDHTALVLSSTQKYSDIQKILQNFAHLDIDSVIFTKLDETLSYGNMLNVASKSKLKVSYVTDGQNVPQDIYVATPEGLAKKILTGVSEFGSSIITP